MRRGQHERAIDNWCPRRESHGVTETIARETSAPVLTSALERRRDSFGTTWRERKLAVGESATLLRPAFHSAASAVRSPTRRRVVSNPQRRTLYTATLRSLRARVVARYECTRLLACPELCRHGAPRDYRASMLGRADGRTILVARRRNQRGARRDSDSRMQPFSVHRPDRSTCSRSGSCRPAERASSRCRGQHHDRR